MNWLFLCSRNKLRSPTAEAVFAEYPGIETDSAGLSKDADLLLESEQIAWADVIFVMEPRHRAQLNRRFKRALANKKVVVLHIPDQFPFMDPELVRRLKAACEPHVR